MEINDQNIKWAVGKLDLFRGRLGFPDHPGAHRFRQESANRHSGLPLHFDGVDAEDVKRIGMLGADDQVDLIRIGGCDGFRVRRHSSILHRCILR